MLTAQCWSLSRLTSNTDVAAIDLVPMIVISDHPYFKVLSGRYREITAHDLGIVDDRSLIMSDHVAAVCHAVYFQPDRLYA